MYSDDSKKMNANKSKRLGKLFIGSIENFIFVSFTLMVILVFINVIGRYFFSSGITAAEELSKILFVWITFIGTILCFNEDGHIIVDILLNLLPGKPQKVVNLISNKLVSVILAVTFYYSINFVLINKGLLSPLTRIPVTIIQAIIPISFGAMFIMNIGKFFKLINN